jgi:hypothetical protein
MACGLEDGITNCHPQRDMSRIMKKKLGIKGHKIFFYMFPICCEFICGYRIYGGL